MNKSIDPARLTQQPNRRQTLALLGAGALVAGLAPRLAFGQDDEKVLTEALVLRDPDIPVAGNPDGDITIVEYFDYNCPYCRKIAPELSQVVQDDGKVRLVLKDWPILGEVSVIASRMALACKYQDKFIQAHDALIGINSKLTEPRIGELLAGAGIDVDRAKRDLASQRQGDRRRPRAQRRSSPGVRLQGHAVLHRRKIPGAGGPDHGAVRSGDRRCTQGSGEQKIRARDSKSALVGDEGARVRIRRFRGYFDDSLTQSSCARRFNRFQSVAATSQLTMVRLADAVSPLATVEVDCES